MEKFKIVAKDTHDIYGTSNHEAVFEKEEKLKMVSTIVITIKTISTKANAGE
jgi:hypothetical protein